MNERFLPKYDINSLFNQPGKRIDPSELNPDTFVNGVAPIIFGPSFLTAPSGTGKAPRIIVIMENTVQDSIPEGDEEVNVTIPGEVSEQSPDSSEYLNKPTLFLSQAQIIQMLGRTGRMSS